MRPEDGRGSGVRRGEGHVGDGAVGVGHQAVGDALRQLDALVEPGRDEDASNFLELDAERFVEGHAARQRGVALGQFL